jgi:hypothetical protein
VIFDGENGFFEGVLIGKWGFWGVLGLKFGFRKEDFINKNDKNISIPKLPLP